MVRDLRALLASLLAPHRVGDEIAPGVRFVGASIELSLRLTFELDGTVVHVEVAPTEEMPRFAAKTSRLGLAYRTGSGSGGEITADAGKALCVTLARLIVPNEERVLSAIAEAAAAAPEALVGSTRVRELRIESLVERADWRGTRYYTVSPYVGCLIGCRFCYAQSRVAMVRRLEGLPPLPWGSFVDVRTNAAEILAAELETLPVGPVKFCPVVSDPYHAVEPRFGITRACLGAIRAATRPFPTMLLTRSALIARDAELLASMPMAYAGMSIPTIDDSVRRHFEPRGAPIAERLATLRALKALGVRTFAVVQPMLPGSTDALAEALATCVGSVSLDVLQSIEQAGPDFETAPVLEAATPRWQLGQAHALSEALRSAGVPVWRGELPPELCAPPGTGAREG